MPEQKKDPWTDGIKIPEGLPAHEIDRLNRIERGEIQPQPERPELTIPLDRYENKDSSPEKN